MSSTNIPVRTPGEALRAATHAAVDRDMTHQDAPAKLATYLEALQVVIGLHNVPVGLDLTETYAPVGTGHGHPNWRVTLIESLAMVANTEALEGWYPDAFLQERWLHLARLTKAWRDACREFAIEPRVLESRRERDLRATLAGS